MNELLTITNGQPTASSLDIAKHFGKEHRNVLRDIEALQEGVLNFEQTPMFLKTTYVHPQNGQEYPMYLMNRDGFTLLAMGFTGKEALEWKVKYINAFNAMEQELRERAKKPMSPTEMFAMQAQINLDYEKKFKTLEGKLENTNKKFDTVANFMTAPYADGDTWKDRTAKRIKQAVEEFGLNYQTFHKELYDELERTAGVDLRCRQARRRNRMWEAGATKTECKGVSKLSIVADDKKLRAMFETILRNHVVQLAASRGR